MKNNKHQGTIYVISAASGTGKTSLVGVLVESLNNIITSISHTTRPKRPNEHDGEHYFFVDEKQFKQMITENEFLEYAKVFGCYYGTSKTWVNEQLNQGNDVILEIDWQGAKQIKQQLPHNTTIFILPPSITELRRRLEKRKQDEQTIIEKRLALAHEEISHCGWFDYIVVNDRFDIALVDLRSIIRSNRLRKETQIAKHDQLLAELTKTG